MYVTQLLSNSMKPSFLPTANSITTTHTHACISDLPQLHLLPWHSLHVLQRSNFPLPWTNNYASRTRGWIFKSNSFLLTRTCLLCCPAVGSMWCTKPRLSTPSTGWGWKANWGDAQLHAPSIHYLVIVTPLQLLERRVSKSPRYVCTRNLVGLQDEWDSLMEVFQMVTLVDPSPNDPSTTFR